LRGDQDGDGLILVNDVATLGNYVNGGTDSLPFYDAGDVNHDGTINEADLSYLLEFFTFGTPAPFPVDAYTSYAVPRDSVIALVNSSEMSCTEDEKGCQRFGLPTIDVEGLVSAYSDTYRLNNPEEYDETACNYEESDCEEFTSSSGSNYYFKKPGNKICNWKTAGEDTSAWYKFGTNSGVPDCPVTIGVCVGGGANDGDACVNTTECDSGLCVRSDDIVRQPTDGWVGACDIADSGCTEYRDPEQVPYDSSSTREVNLLENGGFEEYNEGVDNMAAALTDGTVDSGNPDEFPAWGGNSTDPGRCTAGPYIGRPCEDDTGLWQM